MSAAFSGPAPGRPSPERPELAAEPFLLESVLSDIQALRLRARLLSDEAVLGAAAHPTGPWRRFRDEVVHMYERAEKTLAAAASRDGVPTRELPPRPAVEQETKSQEERLSACRREAHELETQCSSTVNRAAALGLDYLGQALRRWRCDLIGLERLLNELSAAVHAQTRGAGR